MAVSGVSLVKDLRILLHDDGRDMCTDSRFYEDKTLLRALNMATGDLIKDMIQDPRGPRMIALSRFIKSFDVGNAGTTGVTQPDDFFILVCATDPTSGAYFKAAPIVEGISTGYISSNKIYALQGKFFGPTIATTTALYYAVPPKILMTTESIVAASPFFWSAVKYRAASYVLTQEDKDAIERWKPFVEIYKRKVRVMK